MKSLYALAFATLFTLGAGVAEAAPYRPSHGPGHYDGDRGRGHDGDRYSRTEARAQARLRQLGYYRGSIDGSFGPASRRALARFQRERHLPPSGRLDNRTLRALRLL